MKLTMSNRKYTNKANINTNKLTIKEYFHGIYLTRAYLSKFIVQQKL